MSRTKLTVGVEGGTIDPVRRIAADLGFVSDRGRMFGQGNLSAFFNAIASGELQVTRVTPRRFDEAVAEPIDVRLEDESA